ncbi:hypothetical protein IV102_31430 [bacterium]|nr:hypothetical protein [bacterium]
MNYVLPFQRSREVKCLVQKRARQVVDEVLQQVEVCTRQGQGQDGFLTWTSVQGQAWAVFEEGRCLWLLHIDGDNERVCYYRHRGDLEHFELHEPGHAGGSVCQKVEQLGTLIHSYQCINAAQLPQIELKIRWWQAQRWFGELKTSVRQGKAFRALLLLRKSAA